MSDAAAREQVAYMVKCAALNQPQMGVDWTNPSNQRWLDVADQILAFTTAKPSGVPITRERARTFTRDRLMELPTFPTVPGTHYAFTALLDAMADEVFTFATHEAERAVSEVGDALVACLLAQPMANGQYAHLVTCSGDRREPAGKPGHSCSCAIVPRSLLKQAEERARREERALWLPEVQTLTEERNTLRLALANRDGALEYTLLADEVRELKLELAALRTPPRATEG